MMQVSAFGEPGVLHVVIAQCGITTVGKVLSMVLVTVSAPSSCRLVTIAQQVISTSSSSSTTAHSSSALRALGFTF